MTMKARKLEYFGKWLSETDNAELGRLVIEACKEDDDGRAADILQACRNLLRDPLKFHLYKKYPSLTSKHAEYQVWHEVLQTIIRDRKSFDPSRGSVWSWAKTIAHNKAVDLIRKSEASRRKRQRSLGRQLELTDASMAQLEVTHHSAWSEDEGFSPAEIQSRTMASIEQLPPRHRQAFGVFINAINSGKRREAAIAEVGEETGVSRATFYRVANRLRHQVHG